MNYGEKTEPKFLPEFDLKYIIDRWGSYNKENLYLAYYRKIPSSFTFSDIDMKEFHQQFADKFQDCLLGYHYDKYDGRAAWQNDFTYVLTNEILLHKEKDEVTVYFSDEYFSLVREIISFTKEFKIEKPDKAYINLIIMQPHGLDNKKINFTKPELDLKNCYNDDFPVFHEKILEILQEKDKSGLHLLYGKPGTGKSTYIRYLCGLVKKEIVFLPGQMAQNLDNIAMTRYLMDNANCILVIEDAEELIVSRDQQRNSNLAMILNITDGILGESLGIQIIATFNTDVQNIDPALKRKGRLKSAYEFKALVPEKANVLLKEQNSNFSSDEEMTLAEIYNISEEEQYKSPVRRAVGFK
ncbi:AAA family ATPase [Salinimicrobium sp. HB62]|uniref:AAA family ATPase n=1 Tax=Salinimicrobium sp. HB62 TaxID=3077781 RepID=UPI002D76DD8C|nr:AAA family ATPase [Salinimicrobium sp. HB62]